MCCVCVCVRVRVCVRACVCVCVSLSLSLSLSLLDLSLLDLSLHLTVPVSRSVLVLPPPALKHDSAQVLFHVGSLAVQGHYTCSVRSSCGWLDFNDKKIKRIDPMDVYKPGEREQAYILAYVRKDYQHKLEYM